MGSPNRDAWSSITPIPRAFAQLTAVRTMRVACPLPRWLDSVNIDRRYAARVLSQCGLGWTDITQTQPLATAVSPSSTMKPTSRPERMRARAHRRYTRSAVSRVCAGISATASHIPRRCRTRRSRSFSVARRTRTRGTSRDSRGGLTLCAPRPRPAVRRFLEIFVSSRPLPLRRDFVEHLADPAGTRLGALDRPAMAASFVAATGVSGPSPLADQLDRADWCRPRLDRLPPVRHQRRVVPRPPREPDVRPVRRVVLDLPGGRGDRRRRVLPGPARPRRPPVSGRGTFIRTRGPSAGMASESQILVGVTGASGVAYARRLIEVLGDRADVIVTPDAQSVIEVEAGLSLKEFAAGARTLYRGDELAAGPASGSHPFRALVVVPCSGTTLAKIATGIADNLVTRAAAVAMKEQRTLVLVPRETPLGAVPLENRVREDARRDAPDHRHAVHERHVVRLPEESDDVAHRRFRDNPIQAVVQDHAALALPREREDRLEPGGIELPRIDRIRRLRRDLEELDVLAELEPEPVRGRGREAEGRLPFLREVLHPGERDRGIARDDQVPLPLVQMAETAAAALARDRAGIGALGDHLQLPARFAAHRDDLILADDLDGDRLAAVRTAHEAGGAAQVVHRAARAVVRLVALEHLPQAMVAVGDRGGGLGRRRGFLATPEDRRLVDDGRRRLLQLLSVVRPRDESDEEGEGQGEEPVRGPGDVDTEADHPERRRDEVEEDQHADCDAAEIVQPLHLVDRGPIHARMGLAIPVVRAVLEARNGVGGHEHDAEEDLRVLRHIERTEADRVGGQVARIPRRGVAEDLAAGRANQVHSAGRERGVGEAQRADEVVGVLLEDFALVVGRRMKCEIP